MRKPQEKDLDLKKLRETGGHKCWENSQIKKEIWLSWEKIYLDKDRLLNLRNVNEFFQRFSRNRSSLIGLGMLISIFIFGWIVPLFIRVNAIKMVGEPFLPPSAQHLFGTDDLGRELLHQVIIGAQTSIMVGLIAAGLSTCIGLIVGSLSGYYGGIIDVVLMRATEFFMVIPRFFLAVILVAIFGASIWNIIFAIGILSWPRTARIVRGEYLKLKKSEFVDAARSLGANNRWIIFSEILPNAIPAVIVNTALEVGSAITIEAGISFLGLGDPEQISCGFILYQAQMFIRRAPWMSIFSGITIFIIVLGLNLIADGLNEALNPSLTVFYK